jgi:hypothetical protein
LSNFKLKFKLLHDNLFKYRVNYLALHHHNSYYANKKLLKRATKRGFWKPTEKDRNINIMSLQRLLELRMQLVQIVAIVILILIILIMT